MSLRQIAGTLKVAATTVVPYQGELMVLGWMPAARPTSVEKGLNARQLSKLHSCHLSDAVAKQ